MRRPPRSCPGPGAARRCPRLEVQKEDLVGPEWAHLLLSCEAAKRRVVLPDSVKQPSTIAVSAREGGLLLRKAVEGGKCEREVAVQLGDGGLSEEPCPVVQSLPPAQGPVPGRARRVL